MRAAQGEARCVVVKTRCRAPAIQCVARGAISPQLALVRFLPGVAAGAFARRFDAVDGLDVAGGAAHPLVRTAEGKARRLVMVEKRSLPAGGRMTGRAVAAIIALVDIVFEVTGGALHRRPQALVLGAVTGGTGRRAMPADQRKARSAMVEEGAHPAELRMAACAVGAVAALMDIVCQMACDTLFRRAGKPIADMAIGASDHLVCAGQSKPGRGMIETMDILPAAFAVTGGAILAEAGLVNVVLDVTGDAGRGRGAKLDPRFMAVGAGQFPMLAVDGKVGPAMIEAGPLEIDGEFDGPLMLEMTGTTLLFCGRGPAAMKAGARPDIAGDAGMAGHAFSILRRRSECVMAGRAARFELGMGWAERAWTDQPFERRAQRQQSSDHCQKHYRADKAKAPAHQYMWTASTWSATVITRKRKRGTCR